MGVTGPIRPLMPRPDIARIRAVLEAWFHRCPDLCALAKFGITEIARTVRDFSPTLPDDGIAWHARYPCFGLLFDFTYGWLDGIERLVFHRIGAADPDQPDDRVRHLGYVLMLPKGDFTPMPFAPRGFACADRIIPGARLTAARRLIAVLLDGRHRKAPATADARSLLAFRARRTGQPTISLLPADYLRAHVPRASPFVITRAGWRVGNSEKEIIMLSFHIRPSSDTIMAWRAVLMDALAPGMRDRQSAMTGLRHRIRTKGATTTTIGVRTKPANYADGTSVSGLVASVLPIIDVRRASRFVGVERTLSTGRPVDGLIH